MPTVRSALSTLLKTVSSAWGEVSRGGVAGAHTRTGRGDFVEFTPHICFRVCFQLATKCLPVVRGLV